MAITVNYSYRISEPDQGSARKCKRRGNTLISILFRYFPVLNGV